MNQAIREALEALRNARSYEYRTWPPDATGVALRTKADELCFAALAALPDVERVREVCEGLRVAGGHLAGIVGPMRNSGMPFYEGSRDLLFSIEDAVEAAHHALFLLAYPGRSAPGVVCTDCGARLGAEHTYSGSKIQCSACAAKVTIPLPAGAALSPAEPPRQTVFVVESQPELDPSGTPQSPAEPAAPSKVPRLTPEQVRDALAQGSKGAKELSEKLRDVFGGPVSDLPLRQPTPPPEAAALPELALAMKESYELTRSELAARDAELAKVREELTKARLDIEHEQCEVGTLRAKLEKKTIEAKECLDAHLEAAGRCDALHAKLAEAVVLFLKVQSLMDDADMGPRGSSDDEWRIPWTRHAVEVFAEVAMFVSAEPKGGA